MKVLVYLSDDEYAMLKTYAAARRKYEVGKGFRVEDAIAQAVSIGVDAISETTIFDKEGNLVEWKNRYDTSGEESAKRILWRRK